MKFKRGQTWESASGDLYVITGVRRKVGGELYQQPVEALNVRTGCAWYYYPDGTAKPQYRGKFDLVKLIADLVEEKCPEAS